MPTIRERDGRYQAIVRIKQNGQIVHQESRTHDTKKLAEDWGKRVEARIKKEGVATRRTSQTTLADLLGRYREAREEVQPMRRAMGHEFDQLIGHVGTWRLDALTPEAFVGFARKRRAAGAGGATVLHNLATIRSVLNAAKPMFGMDVTGEAVSGAIAALGRSGHVSKSNVRERRVSQDEVEALCKEFERIAGNPSTIIPMAKIVRLAVALPRRLGELTDLKWLDVEDAGAATLRDTKHPTKPRTERVPVPPAAQAIIKSLPRIDACVLPYKSESVSAAFQRACARLAIEDLHFHDLRHEGISRLFEAGLGIEEVALVSGHQSWNMLKRYTHIKPENVLEKLK